MIVSLVMIMFMTGCTSDSISPPSSSFTDRSMTDYSFTDITSACEVHHNINLTYYTDNVTDTPCTVPKKETFMFFTDDNNWSIMCCEFESKCLESTANTTSYDELCVDTNDGGYNGYVFNDDGFWMAQCCNANGGSCYVDLEINVTNDSTVCDEQYHQNTYSVDYNGTDWSSMCCIGGLEE